MKDPAFVWNLYAPVYNMFMRSNREAYERMYSNIRSAVRGKEVLEIAAGTGLISKNTAAAAKNYTATDFARR